MQEKVKQRIGSMSELVITKKKHLGFIPEVVGYVSSLNPQDYIYTDYKVRHPGAVFNIATYYVIMDFIDLLKELEDNQSKYNHENQLDRKFRSLISDFFKFYDSCYEIMLGCCKQHTPPNENRFIWRWLEEEKEHVGQKYKVGKEFNKKTKDRINYFRNINNKLKHTSNTIREEYYQDTSHVIMGFYMEGVTGVKAVGPDDSIHPRHDGNVRSANSYNFKLKELYYLLYMLSEALKDALIMHYKDVYDQDLKFNDRFNEDSKIKDANWKELFKRVNNLPRQYYPNEFNEKIYEVKEENDELIFTEKNAESLVLNGHFGGKQRGDGFTLNFGVPYLSKATNR